MTRIIGLDHGQRRIGVAVGDAETRLAFARPVIRTRSQADAVEQVGRLREAEGAELIVIGLPVTMDGREGHQAERVRAFGKMLDDLGVEIVYADERLTSWEATEQLRAEGATPDRHGGEVDSAAARLILQQYLDALPMAPSHDLQSVEETE